jgi:hypothetical protein
MVIKLTSLPSKKQGMSPMGEIFAIPGFHPFIFELYRQGSLFYFCDYIKFRLLNGFPLTLRVFENITLETTHFRKIILTREERPDGVDEGRDGEMEEGMEEG